MARVVVTGGAGFLGSHLSDALLGRGDEVVAIDNLVTGDTANVEHLFGTPGFTFVEHDKVIAQAEVNVDGFGGSRTERRVNENKIVTVLCMNIGRRGTHAKDRDVVP